MKLGELIKIYWTFVLIISFVNTVFIYPINSMLHTYHYAPPAVSPVKVITINNTTVYLNPKENLAIYAVTINNTTNITVLNMSTVVGICNGQIASQFLPQTDIEVMEDVCQITNKIMNPPSSSILALFGFWVPMFFSIAWKMVIMMATFPVYIFKTLYPIASVNPVYALGLLVGCLLLGAVHVYSILRTFLGKWLE